METATIVERWKVARSRISCPRRRTSHENDPRSSTRAYLRPNTEGHGRARARARRSRHLARAVLDVRARGGCLLPGRGFLGVVATGSKSFIAAIVRDRCGGGVA